MPEDRAQIEADARLIGWTPKEQFRGDPEKWVDADVYLQRGETMLPLAQENNRRLRETNKQLEARLAQMQQTIDGFQTTVRELEEFHTADKKKAVERARARLKEELKAARAAGDVDAETEILDALSSEANQVREEPRKPAQQTNGNKPADDPVFRAWLADNDWFQSDKKMRGVAVGIAEELREERPDFKGRAFYDEVTKRTKAFFEQRTSRPASKTDEGGSGGGSGGAGAGPKGKSYGQMPAEARAECDRQAKKFVGKGYKTIDDWRAYYARIYWESEE